MRHPEAVWTAVMVFFTNLAAIQIARFLDDSLINSIIFGVTASSFAAIAVYAKIRISDAKKGNGVKKTDSKH